MTFNLKKLISAALTLAIFINMQCTLAMKPAVTHEKSAIVNLASIRSPRVLPAAAITAYLETRISRFENIAPGVFFVDPNFRNPKKADPYIISEMLDCMISIFEAFPNLTKKFVEEIQATDSKKFEVEILDPKNYAIGQLFSDCGEALPTAEYHMSRKAITMRINITSDDLKKNVCPSEGYCVKTDSDYITYVIAHEMGHLISSINQYQKEGKVNFLRLLGASDSREQQVIDIRNMTTSSGLNPLILFQFVVKSKQLSAMLLRSAKETKEEIISLARRYAGSPQKYISEYGEQHEDEWFAETFAYLLCTTKKLNPLAPAMQDWLLSKETQLSSSM